MTHQVSFRSRLITGNTVDQFRSLEVTGPRNMTVFTMLTRQFQVLSRHGWRPLDTTDSLRTIAHSLASMPTGAYANFAGPDHRAFLQVTVIEPADTTLSVSGVLAGISADGAGRGMDEQRPVLDETLTYHPEDIGRGYLPAGTAKR